VVLIDWNDSFSVKVAEIDQQHKTLVDLLNELYDAMKIGKGRDVVGKIVENLLDYATTHFSLEERYFVRFDYPDQQSHVAEHADFIRKAQDFKTDLERGNRTLSVEVLRFLSDWLKRHILGADMEYSQFFYEHGLR
jgi:hemerythrin